MKASPIAKGMRTQIGWVRKCPTSAKTLVEDVGCFEGFVAYFADCPQERTAAHLLDSCGAVVAILKTMVVRQEIVHKS
jgi:hypothetical protein